MENRLSGMNRGAMEAFWELMDSTESATLVLLLVEANRKDPMVADCRFQMRNLAIYLAEGRCQSIEVLGMPMAN